MRHKKNRLLELNTGAKTRAVYVRNMLTNLLKNGKVTTTGKRAKVLKSEVDSFFSKLFEITARNEEKDAKRECIRYVKSVVYGEDTGKKVLDVWFPKYQKEERKTGFVADYKLGYRSGDAAEKILLKLL